MPLTEQITDYINAAFTGLWINTHEADEAEREIVRLARAEKWTIAAWDVADGLRLLGKYKGARPDSGAGDPIAALRALSALADIHPEEDNDSEDAEADKDSGSSGKKDRPTTLLLLHNFHRFLNSPEVVQTTFSQLIAGKHQGSFLVVLSPVVQIPVELEKLFVVIEHQLPDREQLLDIARNLTKETPEDLPKGVALERILDAAAGLTRYEAEGAFSLSLTRHDSLRSDCLWELKAQALAKSGLCSLYRGEQRSFEQLKGVDHVRHLTRQLLRPDCPIPPKGWLFVGPPNCGKTSVAKAIATDNGLPLIIADLPSLKAKYVGDSEERVRRFKNLCEAMAPCCVLLDEIEDALAGATSAQSGDSGVSRDQLSTILKWRSESKARVFLMATCNEPENLLKVKQGALFRDGRFDGMVFFDLPDRQAKDVMWSMYRKVYQIPASEPNPPDEGWAPGSIEVCCQRVVQYQISLAEATGYVRPTDPDDIERLRQWAAGRCLSASSPGMYARNGQQASRTTRRIQRGPSNN